MLERYRLRTAILIVLLLISVSILSACAKKSAFTDDIFVTEAETTAEAEVSVNLVAESTTAATEQMSEAQPSTPVQTSAATETSIHATGAEPNPSSPFAQLSSDEQTQLTAWLESVMNSYSKMASAFKTFGGRQGDFMNALKEGKAVADIPSYQELEAACRGELDRLDSLSAESIPEAAAALKSSGDDVAKWYRGFFSELSQKNGENLNTLRQWLEDQSSVAADLIQKFLDQIQNFRS